MKIKSTAANLLSKPIKLAKNNTAPLIYGFGGGGGVLFSSISARYKVRALTPRRTNDREAEIGNAQDAAACKLHNRPKEQAFTESQADSNRFFTSYLN